MPRRSPTVDPELRAHQEWLGYLQPVGLVVAPAAIRDAGWVLTRSGSDLVERQQRYRDALERLNPVEDAALKEALRSQRKRINATLRQRNRDLAKMNKTAAVEEPLGVIPGLKEQIDVPALDLQTLSRQERQQLSADQRHWQRGLEAIEGELTSEPKRIQESYRVITHRLEPAGLVYLWPISG